MKNIKTRTLRFVKRHPILQQKCHTKEIGDGTERFRVDVICDDSFFLKHPIEVVRNSFSLIEIMCF